MCIICLCAYVYVWVYIHACTYVHLCMHAWMCVFVYVCVRACVYVCVRACIRICMQGVACMCMRRCACMHRCVYLFVYMLVCANGHEKSGIKELTSVSLLDNTVIHSLTLSFHSNIWLDLLL